MSIFIGFVIDYSCNMSISMGVHDWCYKNQFHLLCWFMHHPKLCFLSLKCMFRVLLFSCLFLFWTLLFITYKSLNKESFPWSLMHSQLLKGPKCGSKWNTTEERGVGACSLAHNILRGRGACWSFGMGLGRVDKFHSFTRACTQPTQSG